MKTDTITVQKLKKIGLISAFFVVFTGLSNLRSEDVEKVLTLDESINLALSNSQQMLSGQLDIKIAGQRLKESKSGMYPQLEFNTNFSRFEAESPIFISPILGNTILPQKQGVDNYGEPVGINNIENYYTAKISIYQVLWSAGKFSATKKYAETELKTAESNYETIKNRTVANVKKSFYNLLAIQKKINICKETLKQIADEKEDAKNAVDRFKSQRIVRKIEGISKNTEKELELERIDFLDAVGVELDTTFTVVGDFVFKKSEVDLNKCLAWAAEYRPELKKLELQEQMDALEVSLSLSGRYPTVSVGGIYQLEDTQLPFERKSWNATVNINLPVFDGFALASRIRQKKYQYRKVQIYRASVIDNIKAEVRKLYLEYDYSVKQFENRKNDYETIPGSGSEPFGKLASYEALELKQIMFETKLEYIESTKNAIISKIELENAVGKSIN